MFEKKFEERLVLWRQFRETLEFSEDPIQDAIDFYSCVPLMNIAADPYTPSTWPDPWELLEENNYCPFVKILAICYTLQLTDCFSKQNFEIHILHDNENSQTHYVLFVGDRVVGYTGDTHVHRSEIPKNSHSELQHSMPHLQ